MTNISVAENQLLGKYAIVIGRDYEPFLIKEIRIVIMENYPMMLIRCDKEDIWVYTYRCFVGNIAECRDYLDLQENRKAWNNF